MYEAIQALDKSKFKHFHYMLQMIQKYPSSLESDKKLIVEFYPGMVQLILTRNDHLTYKLTTEEMLEEVRELHAEYLELMAAFELAERGEQHEAPSVNAVGQAYCEAPGGYE